MLHGGSIIFTAIISKFMVKRMIYSHHILGCVFSMIGFIIVGTAGVLGSQQDDARYSESDLIIGVIMNIIYMVVSSLMSCVQELILRKKSIDVQRMIGLEGQFGLIWSFLFCVIASYIHCPNTGICHKEGYLDDFVMSIEEIWTQPGLLFWCASAAVAVLMLNLFGLMVVKHMSAVYKAFWGSMSTIIIWIVNVLAGNEDFVLVPALVQIGGFLFLILGNFTYNEIIEWKCCSLNKNLRKYRLASGEEEA